MALPSRTQVERALISTQMPKVVFILGAGASAHLGFPTGAELWEQVINELITETHLSVLTDAAYGAGAAGKFARALRDATVESIDQFMKVQADDTTRNIGRFVVAYKIAEGEFKSPGPMFDRNSRGKNWYYQFRQYLYDRPQLARSDSFSFLTFNYDRSLAHFLYGALEQDSRLSKKNVTSFLSAPNFFHMHGALGGLKWQSSTVTLDYGAENHFNFTPPGMRAVNIAAQLKAEHVQNARPLGNRLLFAHEEVNYDEALRTLLLSASQVVIMGFGFATENCNKVLLKEISQKGIPIIATSINLSPERRRYLSAISRLELVDRQTHDLFSSILQPRFDEMFGIDMRA